MPKHKIPGQFTPRQKELLICIAHDCSYKLAAAEMGIDYETVKSMMGTMRNEFNVHSESALLAIAFKTGQIKPEEL